MNVTADVDFFIVFVNKESLSYGNNIRAITIILITIIKCDSYKVWASISNSSIISRRSSTRCGYVGCVSFESDSVFTNSFESAIIIFIGSISFICFTKCCSITTYVGSTNINAPVTFSISSSNDTSYSNRPGIVVGSNIGNSDTNRSGIIVSSSFVNSYRRSCRKRFIRRNTEYYFFTSLNKSLCLRI